MYKAPRGTADVMPQDQPYWRYIERKAQAICHHYGYQRLDSPLFEEAGLFHRSVGEGTDIVEKEMYVFEDRGGAHMALRPEGTAPACRAYLEHGMYNLPQPVKLFYFAPAFRYERPQAGRFRQHHQFGIEALGEGDPALDAEVISAAWQLFSELGLGGLVLLLNSIGCPFCRPGYRAALEGYYSLWVANLCRDCKGRLERNPLRLLDCKEEECRVLAEDAPKSVDHLCQECHDHFSHLQSYLQALGIPFTVDHRLVRGLDYYTKTVFEIQPQDGGTQSTLAAGGRYDGLIQELGGRPTPGVGFAAGMERIVMHLKRQGVTVPQPEKPTICVAYLGDDAKSVAFALVSDLRKAGVSTLLAFGSRSLKAQLRHANTLGVSYAIIIGEEEVHTQTVLLKPMEEGEQARVLLNDVMDLFTKDPPTGPPDTW